MVGELPFTAAPTLSELAPTASASENPNDDDDDSGNGPRRVQFNDASGNSIPAGFHSGPFTITLGHRPREGDPAATIYYTTSQTTAEWPGGFTFPYNGSNDPARMNAQLKERFDGGVCPMGWNSADREHTYNFTWHPGVQQAQVGATVQATPNPGSRSYASIFTISAIAVIQTPHGHEVSTVRTRSFIFGNNRWLNNDFMVFSIYADANDIFGWNDGILVPGQDRRDLETELARLNPSRYGLTDALGFHLRTAITRNNQTLAAANSSPWNSLLIQAGYPPTWPANFTKRGRAAERLANVEMFDPRAPQGEQRLLNQRVGLRVKGGWSRGTYSYEQRTFELYARGGACHNGDGRDNFLFPLFGQSNNAFDGNLMHRYTRFRVRNGGTDREQLYMRDEMAGTLALMSGKHDAQEYRPAVVFLNGGYYGMVMMKSPRTENHWQRLYGGRRNGFEQIGTNESGAGMCGSNACGRVIPGSSGGSDPGGSGAEFGGRQVPVMCGETPSGGSRQFCNRADCESYWSSPNTGCTYSACRGINGPGSWREVRSLFTGEGHASGGVAVRRDQPRPAGGTHATDGSRSYPSGLQHDANWERLNLLVDLDSLFHYYALNIFGANVDWPGNNVEMWTYFPNCANGQQCNNLTCTTAGCERVAVRNGELHPYLDGRWRFNPHDLEYGWGLFSNGVEAAATHHTNNTIHALLARSGAGVSVPGDPPEHDDWGGLHRPHPYRAHFNASAQTFIMPALLNGYHAGEARALENRQRLANALSDIMLGSHSAANMNRVATAIWTNKENEHRHMIGYGNRRTMNDEHQVTTTQHTSGERRISEFPRGNPWGEIPGAPYWTRQERPWEAENITIDSNAISGTGSAHTILTNFLANRGTAMQGFMGRPAPNRRLNPSSNTDRGPSENWGLGLAWSSGRAVQATVGDGGWAQINTRVLGMRGLDQNDPRGARSAELRHFGDAPVTVTVYPWPGYRVAGVSGGTRVDGRQNTFVTRGASSINVTFERIPRADQRGLDANVNITAIQARAEGTRGNWIEITNNTGVTINTRGLYMSDNFDRIEDSEQVAAPQDREFDFRWRMPALILRPGQTIFIRTTGSTEGEGSALKGMTTNFGITFGERLRLADARGNVLQRVEVSLMTNSEMQRRGVGANGEDDGNWRIVPWDGTRNQMMHPART
jgi:hypothetical protein